MNRMNRRGHERPARSIDILSILFILSADSSYSSCPCVRPMAMSNSPIAGTSMAAVAKP
jgi:hypothetical protein